MSTDDVAPLLHIVAGLALLVLGRRLFWLFVGVIGFVVAFEVVPILLPDGAHWLVLCIAIVVGLLGAWLAIALQYLAAAFAGFAAGAYASAPLAAALGALSWMPLIAGIAGATVIYITFDWALIALSSMAGARALVTAFGLNGSVASALWLGLAGLGVAVQASFSRRSTRR